MADNVDIIVQDTINDIVVNAAVVVETIDINVQAAVDVVDIVANPNNYVVNINRIIGEQVQSDWNQTDNQAPDYIKNKPSIPTATSDLTNDGEDGVHPFITAADVTAQVNSDWNATSGVAQILNKPTIPTNTSDLVNDGEDGINPFITLADVPVPTNGLPTGGTAGQILTKVDSVDYNATWQENFADWTSVVKHTVKNNGLSGTITKGTAVYVTGSNGTNMLVGRASNASEATSSKTMGLMQSDITTTGGTQTGFVIAEGLLGGLNTQSANAGDPVWLGVNGALIYGLANKPYAPAHLVFIGIVTKVSAGNGEIFVKVQNGFELKEIHDVDLITTTPVNGQVLGFDGTLWVNKTVAGWLGFTPVTNARTISTTSPLSGGGDLSADRTLSISQANTSTNGYLSSTDWNTFNNKQAALGFTAENVANKSISTSLGTSDTLYPTQNAVKVYADTKFQNPTFTNLSNRDLLSYNSATSLWENTSFYNYSLKGVQYFTDFQTNGNTTPYLQQIAFGTGATTSRTAISVPNATINQIGFACYQSGTTSPSYANHISDTQLGGQFQIGGGNWFYETYLSIETLSNSSERFRFISGFGNATTNNNDTNCAMFTYDEGGTANGTSASANWQCITSTNSVRTLTITSVAVTTNWVKLRIIINAAGTSVSYYINGTLVATHTTNIPIWISFSNPRPLCIKQSIVKTIGTTSRNVWCDYLLYENTLTNLR